MSYSRQEVAKCRELLSAKQVQKREDGRGRGAESDERTEYNEGISRASIRGTGRREADAERRDTGERR